MVDHVAKDLRLFVPRVDLDHVLVVRIDKGDGVAAHVENLEKETIAPTDENDAILRRAWALGRPDVCKFAVRDRIVAAIHRVSTHMSDPARATIPGTAGNESSFFFELGDELRGPLCRGVLRGR